MQTPPSQADALSVANVGICKKLQNSYPTSSMFQLWRARSHSPELLEEAGKWPRGYTHTSSRACPQLELSARIKEYVPSITHTQSTPNVAAYITGKIGNHSVSLLLDSGASCSVVRKDHTSGNLVQLIEGTKLVDADRRTHISMRNSCYDCHPWQFTSGSQVLDILSTPVILGCDFLTKHNFLMDFSQQAVHHSNNPSFKLDIPLERMSSCNALTLDDELPQALATIVKSTSAMPIEMPADVHPDLVHLINNYRQLFFTQLEKTTTMEHVIDTGEAAPIKVLYHFIMQREHITNCKKWLRMASYGPATVPGVHQLYMYPSKMEKFIFVWTLSSSIV